MAISEKACAKVNLTLAVLGRRADGYHVLDSLVAFAEIADELSLDAGPVLGLDVSGPTAGASGMVTDNLVLKAGQALAQRVPDLQLGHFHLIKNLPAAAGVGGGSADAAAALRLLATANRLSLADPLVIEAAREVGSDVPVCLEQRARWMRGAGECLSEAVPLPSLPAVLVNPGVATPTADIFRALALSPGRMKPYDDSLAHKLRQKIDAGAGAAEVIGLLGEGRNDLEPPAIGQSSLVGEALRTMAAAQGCGLARMSGSGATVFGLFETVEAASAASRSLAAQHPSWWVRETRLGSPGS